MATYRVSRRLAATGVALALVSCATRHAPPQVAQQPPVAEPIPQRPRPPAGASATMAVPPRAPDGGYLTVNSGITATEAAWHLRAALNVAALGCRGADGEAITQAYNAMLRERKAALNAADKAIQARFKAERGSGWQDAHDDRMTQLYNFYAMPPVQSRFCKVAASVAMRERSVAPADFTAFAPAALAEISAPFTDFYAAYERYTVDLASWDARYGGGATRVATLVAPAPAPAAPVLAPVAQATAQTAPAPVPAATLRTAAVMPAVGTRVASKDASPKIAYASTAEVDSWSGSHALACARCGRSRVVSR